MFSKNQSCKTEIYKRSVILKRLMTYYKNKIKNAIIKANKAIASVKANPKIASLNKSSFKLGFLAVPIIKAPKITPIPTPAPANPTVDNPAPIFCAAANNICKYANISVVHTKNNTIKSVVKVFKFYTKEEGLEPSLPNLEFDILPLNYPF